MKFKKNDQYFQICVYVLLTAVSIYLAFSFIGNIDFFLDSFFGILNFIYDLLKPLLIAFAIAYLLYPISNLIESFCKNNRIYKVKKDSKSRIISVAFSYILVLLVIAAIIYGISYMIGGQLGNNSQISSLTDSFVEYINNTQISTETLNDVLERFDLPNVAEITAKITESINSITTILIDSIASMTTSVISIGSNIFSFTVSFILSIYLLKDREYFMKLFGNLFTLVFRESFIGKGISHVALTLNDTFMKYIRGQFLEAFFVAVMGSIALFIVDIDYALVIGGISGICNLIPYVGPLVGTVLAAIMGLLSGQPLKILWAIIAMQVVQQIDNNLLAPKIVGNSVGLHPVFTMLAIIIGGNYGGLLGMLLAVPIAASVKILFVEWYNSYTKMHNSAQEVISDDLVDSDDVHS